MEQLQLFMVLIGCRPAGRFTEQHDVFFGIGTTLKSLLPELYNFWPEAKGKIHIDAWRAVEQVGNYAISIETNEETNPTVTINPQLFFINLGGYKKDEFEEFHYKMIVAAADKSAAIKQAKQTAFYKHTGFKTAPSHIDDKYGIDVDDLFQIKDILPKHIKHKYRIKLTPIATEIREDELHLGYLKFENVS